MPQKKETILSDSLSKALHYLREEQCVAIPTETVYGLAADARSEKAVADLYLAKGRPAFNPLIIHVDSLDMARKWGRMTDLAESLAAAFWLEDISQARPLTVVVDCINPSVTRAVTAGLSTIGIRLPAHVMAKALIREFGSPLAAPSANRSNYISPTSASAVLQDLNGRIPMILDGGPCMRGLESTIVDATGDIPVLLRAGTTTQEEILRVVPNLCFGNTILAPRSDQVGALGEGPSGEQVLLDLGAHASEGRQGIIAPGMLKRHYAPSIPIRLNCEKALEGEAYLGFGEVSGATLNLSPAGLLEEAATNLFSMLRQLDQGSYRGIAIAPIPDIGIGRALNDRLRRGAHPG